MDATWQLASVIKGATIGDSHAQWELGRAYEKAMYGLRQDNNKAAEWYERAAAQDHPMAEGQLGWFYFLGFGGLRVDCKMALHMWHRAANKGEVISMGNLAFCYASESDDIDVVKDKTRGIEWLKRGIEMGDERCVLLMCQHDPHQYRVPKVVTQVSAIREMAWMHSSGRGRATKDKNLARECYKRAGMAGD